MELVVLVDEFNTQIGVADKQMVHTSQTPLHRGFSLFIFNAKKELLLTQRALTKKTFPGIWSNTVCGHPLPNEDVITAAKRRLKDELRMSAYEYEIVKSDYMYSFTDQNGIKENEICPILVAHSNAFPRPDFSEIADWKWLKWEIFLVEAESNSSHYSPWSIEEAKIIAQKNLFV